MIQRYRGNSRIFTFGIGNSVNRYLIEAMSSEGRGDHEIVTLDSDVDAAASRLVQRTDSPILTDVSVKFQGVAVNDVLPRYIPDVFSEKPVVVKGRYSKAGKGFVIVSGKMGGKPWSEKVPITFPGVGNSGSSIGSLWAREKVNDLELDQRIATTWAEDRNQVDPREWDERITELALKFNIMTRFTSFVAVDNEVSNPGGQQKTIPVPVDMADGMEYEKIFGSMAPKRRVASAPAPATPAFRPGDPLLSVVAPMDATVVAVFPGGDLKPLAWNDATKRWEVRFDIPVTFREGIYQVKVHVRQADGERRSFDVPFEVSETAPDLVPTTTLVDGAVRWQIPGDTRWERFLLFTPDNEKLEFIFDAASNSFRLSAPFKAGWYKLVGADRAFSQRTIRVLINGKGEIEKIEPNP